MFMFEMSKYTEVYFVQALIYFKYTLYHILPVHCFTSGQF